MRLYKPNDVITTVIYNGRHSFYLSHSYHSQIKENERLILINNNNSLLINFILNYDDWKQKRILNKLTGLISK